MKAGNLTETLQVMSMKALALKRAS
jgi:hypothetical protein